MSVAKDRYFDALDGVWYDQPRKDRVMCCDCRLVHNVEYRLKGRTLQVKFTRNDRATAMARRNMDTKLIPRQG